MMNEKKSLIDIVQNEGRAVTVPVGISMWPMLKNRKNAIVIEKVTNLLKNMTFPCIYVMTVRTILTGSYFTVLFALTKTAVT